MTQVIYTLGDNRLGRVLVAATHYGICALSMGDTDDELKVKLARSFVGCALSRDDAALQEWVDMLLGYLNGQRQELAKLLNSPVDVRRGTVFQRCVWDALRSIPYGETRSYGDIADQIGQPKAFRAVANACGSNPVSLIIPCHRVVRSDGGLGGYGGGVGRKKALLEMEKRTQ